MTEITGEEKVAEIWVSVTKGWITGLILCILGVTSFIFKLSVRYSVKLPCSEWTLNFLLVYSYRFLVGHNASSVLLDVKNNKLQYLNALLSVNYSTAREFLLKTCDLARNI